MSDPTPSSHLLSTTQQRALFVATLLLSLFLSFTPLLSILELKLLDQQWAWKRRWQPSQTHQVVVVGVDEGSEKAFAEPLALWHRHFADVFRGLALGKARGVGLDYTLPTRSFENVMPGLDGEMVRGLFALRQANIPLVIGVAVEGDYRIRPIHPLFLTVNGDNGNGIVMTPLDTDNVLRRFQQAQDPQGNPLPTFSHLLAQRLNLAMPPSGYVDFAHGQPFHYIPFYQVVEWVHTQQTGKLLEHFQDKVVFIGSVLPFQDRHVMPGHLAGWEGVSHHATPGVLFHAQTFRTLLGPGFIQPIAKPLHLGLMVLVCAALFWLSRKAMRGILSWVAVALACVLAEYALLRHRLWLPSASLIIAAMVGALARIGVEFALQLKEKRRLQNVFGGYVSPAILKDIISGKIHAALEGQRRLLCVLFSDIRGFTTLSEGMAPEALISLLNAYFTHMTGAIHQHGGTVDKFIGDGIMAFFGAPEKVDNPCVHAFQAAQAMLQALETFNQTLAKEGKAPLKIGIGLHFGEAAVGHVGSASRHEYTAIGDTVNVASRVEGATKQVGYALLCTQPVFEKLTQADLSNGLVCVGEQPLKGHTPVALYGWAEAPLSQA